jgi:hypothetical protein
MKPIAPVVRFPNRFSFILIARPTGSRAILCSR